MGVAESKLPSEPSGSVDGITTISRKRTEIDPLLEKLQGLEIVTPLFKSPPAEVGLKDVLLRHAYGSEHGSLDPTSTASLLTLYQEWQRVTSNKIKKHQEDLNDKIDILEALALKLLQRFNSSVDMMKEGSNDLHGVYVIKVEVDEIKHRLNEVLKHYNTLEKRIEADGPHFLQNVVKPIALDDV